MSETDLLRRVVILERRVLLLGSLLIAFVVCAIACAAVNQKPQDLRVRTLTVVDDNGAERITLGVKADDGGPAIVSVNDRDGQPRVFLSAASDVARVGVRDSKSKLRALMLSFNQYSGFAVSDPDEKPRLIGMTAAESGDPSIQILGERNNPLVQLSTTAKKAGGLFEVMNSRGKTVVNVQSNQNDVGLVITNRADGAPRDVLGGL